MITTARRRKRVPAPVANDSPNLTAALTYAARYGWHVFPLHNPVFGDDGASCSCRLGDKCPEKTIGKHPRTPKGCNDATTDVETIRQWWTQWPDASIGIATGARSGFAVVDVDSYKGADEELARLEREHGKLPATVRALTGGGGVHYLFKCPTVATKGNQNGIFAGIDWKGSGGYIIAAPSVHRSRTAYRWDPDAAPESVALADLPAWILERVRTPDRAANDSAPDQSESERQATYNELVPLNDRIRRASNYIAKLPPSIEGEGGSNAMFEAALVARKGFVLPRDAAFAALERYNERAVPPWSGPEIDHKLDGVDEAHSVPWGYLLPTKEKEGSADAPSRTKCLARGDSTELAKVLLKQLGDVVYDDGGLWRYDASNGTWAKVERSQAGQLVSDMAGAAVGEKARPLMVNDHTIIGATNVANMLAAKPGFFSEAPVIGVTFADCFVHVDGGKIIRSTHDRQHRARHRFPFAYAPDLPHPLLDHFFAQVFVDAKDKDDRVALLQEFAGACLVGHATRYQKCLVLYGDGGTGKGTTLSILRALFPPGTVVSIAPHKWGDRFTVAHMVGALANFVDEMPATEIVSSEAFKYVITGDPQTAERKFQDPFTFSPRAGHIFSANSLPGTRDQTNAFWDRIMMLRFDRKFRDTPEQVVDAHLSVLQELPAIVAWALEGARRRQANRKYTVPPTSVEAAEEWKKQTNSVAQFADTLTRLPPESIGERASDVYDAYRRFCSQQGLHPVRTDKFARRMSADEIGLPSKRTTKGVFYPVKLATAQYFGARGGQ